MVECLSCAIATYGSLALFLLSLVYIFSSVFRFYVRIILYYITVLVWGIFTVVFMVPSYLRQEGADRIFKPFAFVSSWTGMKVEVRDYSIFEKTKGAAVIVSNHQGRTIFVDRFHREEACKTVAHCVKQLEETGFKIWVFPEGTRNEKDGMLPFKKGAFNIAVKLTHDDVEGLVERVRKQMLEVLPVVSNEAALKMKETRAKTE